jgi:hypothetical protein
LVSPRRVASPADAQCPVRPLRASAQHRKLAGPSGGRRTRNAEKRLIECSGPALLPALFLQFPGFHCARAGRDSRPAPGGTSGKVRRSRDRHCGPEHCQRKAGPRLPHFRFLPLQVKRLRWVVVQTAVCATCNSEGGYSPLRSGHLDGITGKTDIVPLGLVPINALGIPCSGELFLWRAVTSGFVPAGTHEERPIPNCLLPLPSVSHLRHNGLYWLWK